MTPSVLSGKKFERGPSLSRTAVNDRVSPQYPLKHKLSTPSPTSITIFSIQFPSVSQSFLSASKKCFPAQILPQFSTHLNFTTCTSMQGVPSPHFQLTQTHGQNLYVPTAQRLKLHEIGEPPPH